tara:strand:+ start:18 stop:365 length:348 start_codon:yes stop_codon:yes gene_type:complete
VNNLTTFSQLVEQFQIQDFVEKTIQQLNKDLNGLAESEIKLTTAKSENVLDDLIVVLSGKLDELSRISQLQQFIYIVDLKENEWLSFISNQDLKSLAEQIIIREAQKVYLREMFN